MKSDQINRDASWAFASDKLGRWLLHLPSGAVGKVEKVYAPGEYFSGTRAEVDREALKVRGSYDFSDPRKVMISVAVIGFEDGNAFLADPQNFQPLSEGDLRVFLAMTKGVWDLCQGILKVSGRELDALGSTPKSIAAVMRAALQDQIRALTPR